MTTRIVIGDVTTAIIRSATTGGTMILATAMIAGAEVSSTVSSCLCRARTGSSHI